jgi:glycolate dehydrogenase FAD-linked subunit
VSSTHSAAATGELARLIGREHVLHPSPGSQYNFDASARRGITGRADAAVLPGTAEEVRAVVEWCYAHDVPVVPRGGGTGLVGGAVATEGGVVLSLERLRRVRALEPGLWRMLPEAGVTTRHVQRLARENGLLFGPDPGGAEQSQIGGNVATNAGGPHALKYGVTGAWVTGLEAVLAPGELVGIGGWIRKDVAGYDIKDLLIGSEGTLGVITAVRLRLLPAPEAAFATVVFLRDREHGCAAMEQILAAGLRPSVLDFLDGATLAITARSYPSASAIADAGDRDRGEGGGGVPEDAGFALIVELDGSRAEAQEQRAELLALMAGEALEMHEPSDPTALWRWRDGVNPTVTAVRGAKVSGDVVFPLERLLQGLRRFAEIAERHGLSSCVWGHGGEGNVHATVLVDPESGRELDAADAVSEELYALAAELGGSIAGEHGVGVLKRGRLAAQWEPRAVELHEAIKRAFDPKGLLNPGKKLARYPAPSLMTTG